MRRLLISAASVFTIGLIPGCRDVPTVPLATPAPGNSPALAIVDAAHGGQSSNFYFLPPLVPAPQYTGVFDPTLSPVVEICVLVDGGCQGNPVAVFTTSTLDGSERVRVESDLYIVNWHTKSLSREDGAIYRVTVKLGTAVLGYADVTLQRARGRKAATEDDVISRHGGALPIKFRIEQGALSPTKPVWKFSILGAFSQQTADSLGGFEAAKRLMLSHIDTLNSRFNTPGVFAGEFAFSLDSVYQYPNESPNTYDPHPGFDYKYVIDGFRGPLGWIAEFRLVYLQWPIRDLVTPGAADVVVHEFGHARGAIDLYAIKADGMNNPVNGASYHAGRSIMDFPYGETVWDQHSINLINRSADVVNAPPSYITEAFPASIGIAVVDASGRPQAGATVKLYPVPWYGNRVDPTPRYVVSTDANGEFVFPSNPFEPGALAPWFILYPNYLVTVEEGGFAGYGWMPITDVQNAWFAHPAAPYRLRIVVGPSGAVAAS